MKKYYYNCPRGFSNEFAIISVEQTNAREVAQMAKLLESYRKSQSTYWDLHQITAARARQIVAAERATRRSYISADLNLCENPVGATEITTATEYFAEY